MFLFVKKIITFIRKFLNESIQISIVQSLLLVLFLTKKLNPLKKKAYHRRPTWERLNLKRRIQTMIKKCTLWLTSLNYIGECAIWPCLVDLSPFPFLQYNCNPPFVCWGRGLTLQLPAPLPPTPPIFLQSDYHTL